MKFFRIYTIVTASILALLWSVQPLEGCISLPYGEDIRFSAFQPDLSEAAGFSPFYFSADHFNEGDEDSYYWYYGELRTCDEAANIEEWRRYSGASPSAIDSVLYETDPDDFFDAVHHYKMNTVELNANVKKNLFTEYLVNRNKKALAYMIFAKKCEHYHLAEDPWGTRKSPSYITHQELDSTGLAEYRATNDEFLKMRYAYQLVRLNRFDTAIYDSLIGPLKQESIVKYWALSFKGMALQAEGKNAEGNLILSKVFEHVEDKQWRARSAFEFNYFEQTMQLARTDHEKAVLLVMREVRNPGKALPVIKRIHKLDPLSKELEMLLVREVNKIEDWLLTPAVMNEDPAAGHNPTHRKYDKDHNEMYSWVNREGDKKYADELRKFVTSTASEGKIRTPALWHITAAYLAMINNKSAEALEQLMLAEGYGKMRTRLAIQHRMTRALACANELNNDSTAITTIQNDLLWLDKKWKLIYKPLRTMQHFFLALSDKFLASGDTVTAGLLRLKSSALSERREAWDGYDSEWRDYLYSKASPEAMDRIVERIKRKKKNKFEEYLTREALPKFNYIFDLQGTWHMRHDQLEQAQAAYCQAPDSFWRGEPFNTYLNVNAFHVNIDYPHFETRHDSDRYTKPQLVERLIALKKEAAKGGPGAGEKYLLIGNAYFNMTWHGNSWLMMNYWWSGEEPDSPWWMDRWTAPAGENYYGCTRAKKYYLRAMQLSPDKEIAARACLMAGICDRNYLGYISRGKEVPRNMYGKYFKLLNTKYDDTYFYDKLLNECPGIASYLVSAYK